MTLIPILARARGFVDDLGFPFELFSGKLSALEKRLGEKRFHLAVLGQFKRGKSTLINALLGQTLLPTSILPLTSIPTFLRFGERLRARVHFLNGSQPQMFEDHGDIAGLAGFLARYVTEESNPRNRLEVSHVEVFHSSGMLQEGVVLIDTPGIGSTFRHNTEMTLNFLSECDAALFVVSPDPPITEVEVDFLREVKGRVSPLFFVLNKIDPLDRGERELAVGFLGKTLEEHAEADSASLIFPVSARQGLQAKTSADPRLLEKSGLPELEKRLLGFLASEKHLALEEAVARKTRDILAEVLMRIRLTRHALEMPVSELSERLRLFQEKVLDAKRQLVSSQDLLEGDKKRTAAFLESLAESLRHAARNDLRLALRQFLEKAGEEWTEEQAGAAVAVAIPAFFEREMGKMAHRVEEKVKEDFAPHEERLDRLVESVRLAASELFEIPYHPLSRRDGFDEIRRPDWVTQKWSASFGLFSEGFLDRLLPGPTRRSRAAKRVLAHIESLAVQNVEDIRWPLLQHLNETFHRFGSSLRERLEETVLSIEEAVKAAEEKRRDRESSISEQLKRLDTAGKKLEEILDSLK